MFKNTSSNPNNKSNYFVGTGYKLGISRSDGEITNKFTKQVFGQNPIITTSGLSSCTNVIVNTPITSTVGNKSTQTQQSMFNKPWCKVHYASHPPCATDKQMIEQNRGTICPTCNSMICYGGGTNMCC